MKLKKKVKRIIIIILILALIAVVGLYFWKKRDVKPEVKEVKVLHKIDKYGYELKDTKSKKYQALYNELVKILDAEEPDEEKYVSKIAEMFIVDFYSLNDRTAKTDVGGVDFVHPDVLNNFLLNAEDTYYKYIESNVYGNRTQKLPTVNTITIDSVEKTRFDYNGKTDENAYKVKATWTYKEEDLKGYQQEASMIFVHEENKLYLVELG